MKCSRPRDIYFLLNKYSMARHTRKLTPWNLFVRKIYKEGKARNAHFAFKDALAEASRRKHEMQQGHRPRRHQYRHSKRRMRGGTHRRGHH